MNSNLHNLTSFPDLLAQVNRLSYDYLDGHGIDFEPFEEFLSQEDTLEWFRAWTGNSEASMDQLRVFGQDGAGGYAAIWIADADKPLLEQPVVFLDSEGLTTVVASHFSDYLWLLAGNHGAGEACRFVCDEAGRNEAFAGFAAAHASAPMRTPTLIVAEAQRNHPGFEAWVQGYCR